MSPSPRQSHLHRVKMALRWGISVWTVLMSTFLSGQAKESQLALVGQDVLLHCPCPGSQTAFVVWQINEDVVAEQHLIGSGSGKTDERFRNRTRLYLAEEQGNCSLLLRKVSVPDELTYTCYYQKGDVVEKTLPLLLAANYTVQLETLSEATGLSSGSGRYRCQASGGYPLGRISWLLDGVPADPEWASGTQEIQQFTGLYNLSSTLSASVVWNSTLVCVVENPRLHLNITAALPPAHTPTSSTFSGSAIAEVMVPTSTFPRTSSTTVSAAVTGILVMLLALLAALLTVRYRRRCQHKKEYSDVINVV